MATELDRSGRPNGASRTRPFDRWFRYPAGFSEAALTAALDSVGHANGRWLVDPFAGAAVGGTAALVAGWRFAGIEAHPAIAELADLKFRRASAAADLVAASADTVERAEQIAPVVPENDLLERSFDSAVLANLCRLKEAILAEQTESQWRVHLKWALLGTLRDVASVKVGWPYQRPALARQPPHRDVQRRFLQRAARIAEDLIDAPSTRGSRVIAGDSGAAQPWRAVLGGQKAAACVTSPPYLNNFDYADATRLEMYFWGHADSWNSLVNSVRADMLIATTQQTRRDHATAALQHLLVYPGLARRLDDLRRRLETERVRRGRGKEYDRVLAPYFLGIARVLSRLHKNLSPGATCAWVVGDSAPYGIYIDTPGLIGALSEELGFVVDADVPLRRRGHRWRTNGTRHQVELSERLLTFRRA
jgi:hypothetical protein